MKKKKEKMTLKAFARLGGFARWKGVSKKEQSKIMRAVSLKRLNGKGKLKRKRRKTVVVEP